MSYYYLPDSKNSISSQEQGEESLAECFSDIPAFVLSRLNLTRDKSSCSANEMASCQSSQYGMTLQRSTGDRGADSLMLCAGDSPVRTSVRQVAQTGRGCTGREVDCGWRWLESFARYDLNMHLWKTHQLSLFGDSMLFSGIWPRWGMMQDGECFRLPILAHDTSVKEYGSLPVYGTPIKTQRSRSKKFMSKAKNPFELCQKGFLPSPKWCENLMDWPMEWTGLQPLETDKFQQWFDSHGKP